MDLWYRFYLLTREEIFHCTLKMHLSLMISCFKQFQERINFDFETVFETGVDEMTWDSTQHNRNGSSIEWPSIQAVKDYRSLVKEMVLQVIETAPLPRGPITKDSPWWSLLMGIEHQRIHIETTSVLLKQFPVEYLRRPIQWKYAPINTENLVCHNDFIKMKSGDVTFGKSSDSSGYGWDIDYGEISMLVPSFEATQFLVTNEEFLKFVQDGGYSNTTLWTEEGWQWLQQQESKHPVFWVCQSVCKSLCGGVLSQHSHCNPSNDDKETSEYRYRAMFDVIDMPLNWPVEVNYHEAKAYCKWKGPGYRLPCEAEYHRMKGGRDMNSLYSNINFSFGSPTPVNMFPCNDFGFYDVTGNLWEWIEDDINGLPGYTTHYLYEDYSSPFFDSQHTMMLGGCWATSGSSINARNWFRRHFHQHCGLRVVQSFEPPPVRYVDSPVFITGIGTPDTCMKVSVDGVKERYPDLNIQHEWDRLEHFQQHIQQLKEIQYGKDYINHCLEIMKQLSVSTTNALVLGCGAGYSCCILSRVFNKLTWLPNEIKGFSLIVIEFLERLMEPKGWLLRLHECISDDGLVVFITDETIKSNVVDIMNKWFQKIEETDITNKIVGIWRKQ